MPFNRVLLWIKMIQCFYFFIFIFSVLLSTRSLLLINASWNHTKVGNYECENVKVIDF